VLHKIVQPPEKLTKHYRKTVEQMFKEKWILEKQSLVLMQLRDSLLPRLISSELQIPEEILAS